MMVGLRLSEDVFGTLAVINDFPHVHEVVGISPNRERRQRQEDGGDGTNEL